MKLPLSRRGITALLVLPLFGALCLAVPRAAPAAGPAPPASAAAPSVDPAPPTSAAEGQGPAAPSIGDWVPPEAASAMPKAAEWDTAAVLTLLRPHVSCTARAIREWMQIRCGHPEGYGMLMGVRVVGGSEEGVRISDGKAKVEERTVDGVNVMFPVKKGDRRLIAIDEALSVGFKSYAIEENNVIMISELWLPGDRGPTIVVY
jgi:hypothetical protein